MGYKAVFVGSGAGLPMFMHIPGEALAGRLLRQRVPDPDQPDEGLHATSYDTPIIRSKRRGRGGRRQRGHGRGPLRHAHGRGARVHGLPPRRRRRCPPGRRRVHHAKEEGIEFKLPEQPRGNPGGRRTGRGVRHGVHPHGAGRARRLAAAAGRSRCPAASLSWRWTR